MNLLISKKLAFLMVLVFSILQMTGTLFAKNVKKTIDVVDYKITDETKSLFTYLESVGEENILFGQQHATTEGLTIDSKDGTQSDIYNCVGDFPAVYGWDTLSIEGKESPGSTDLSPKENADKLVDVVKKAYERDGIITLSAHMPNFVTGGTFYDTSGDVISNILPGGDKHKEYNEFLDDIAYFALNVKDEEENFIPIIFRPFHENTGSWFWWGESFCTVEQYKSIYRYTVEYLRDKKGVHNFLYAYSPSSDFTSEKEYLERYPGDDFVDIIGFDMYDDSQDLVTNANWLDGLVDKCEVVTDMANSRNKIAALTETGMSKGIKDAETRNKEWYKRLGEALNKANKEKKIKIAYTQVWANFDFIQYWTPYKDHEEYGNHILVQDFIDFYESEYTLFNSDLNGEYLVKDIKTKKEKSYMYLVTPTDGDKIREDTKIRVKVNSYGKRVKYVKMTVGEKVYFLKKDCDGFYSVVYKPSVDINGSKIDFNIEAKIGKDIILKDYAQMKIFASIDISNYDFSEGILGASYEGSYAPNGASVDVFSVEHTKEVGKGAVKVNASFKDDDDSSNWTYQEMKIKIPNLGSLTDLNIANQVNFDILLPNKIPDSLFKPYIILYKDEEPGYQKHGEGSLQISLADFVKDADLYRYTVSVNLTNQEDATDLVLAFVANDWNYEGEIYFDNLKFSNYASLPALPDNVVDNYEIYYGDNEELNLTYNSQGDPISVSLIEDETNEGYELKYDYTIDSNGYCGVTKQLNNLNWENYNTLEMELKPDGSKQKLVIQIKAGGVCFEVYPSLVGTEKENIAISFDDFVPAPWENDQTAVFTENLDSISQAGIYINGVDGYTGSGTLIMDDIIVSYLE